MRHKPTSPKRNQKQIDFLMEDDTLEILYGGAAGGGKSEALLMAALQYVEVPGYAAIIFRRTYADLALPGALMDRASQILANTGAHWNGQEKMWTFPSGATLSFGYLDKENDRYRYQSSEFQYIAFDELTQFKERDYTYLFSRLRRTTNAKIPLRMRAGSNPGGIGHLWVKKRFDPEGRRGPIQGRKFIGARIEDNPYIDIETYERSLMELDSQTRKQLRLGDWTDFGGNHYFPALWPRYEDVGDAYRLRDGERWRHVRKADCSRLLGLDWAMGKPKKNAVAQEIDGMMAMTGDHTAFVVADMDNETGALYLLYCLNERIPMGSNAPRLAEVCRRWRPLVVAGDDDNLSVTMQLETRRYRDIPTTKPMAIGGKNKLVRSQAAIVRAERGGVYLPEADHLPENDWIEPLCDQLAAFTGADDQEDDIADAMGIIGRLADEFVPGEDVLEIAPSVVGSGGYDGAIYGNGDQGYEGQTGQTQNSYPW